MIKSIKVCSQREIFGILHIPRSLKDSVLISIVDTQNDRFINSVDPNNNTGCIACLQLSFVDCFPGGPQLDKDHTLFSENQAMDIIKFISKHANIPGIERLFIHCTAGISRSGAVGLFACKFLGLNESEFISHNSQIFPNSYILNLLEEMAGMKQSNSYELYENLENFYQPSFQFDIFGNE